ncbi:MAG: hypothetical protein ACR2HJ_02905 [Fimbriimonadales bacterium]
MQETWQLVDMALRSSPKWIIVGYSLPAYDELVQRLLREAASHNPTVHVFDPDPSVARKFVTLLPGSSIQAHAGIPDGIPDVAPIFNA